MLQELPPTPGSSPALPLGSLINVFMGYTSCHLLPAYTSCQDIELRTMTIADPRAVPTWPPFTFNVGSRKVYALKLDPRMWPSPNGTVTKRGVLTEVVASSPFQHTPPPLTLLPTG